MYTWLLGALEREYETVQVLKETPRSSVHLIRHRASGEKLILRRFQGNGEVYRQLLEEIARFKQNGGDEASFERVRKAVYGLYVRSFESIEGVASAMLANSFDGLTLYDLSDATAAVTLEELNAVLKTQFAPERAAISIVNPVEG